MTEDEIFEYLKKQEEEMNKKPVFYVHYNISTGVIINFRNYLETTDPLPYISLTEEELNEPLDKFNISNYKVVKENGKTKLEVFVPEDLSLSKIDDFIYEIPKIKCTNSENITEPYDLLIEQDNISKEFRVRISDECKLKYEIGRAHV